MRISIVGKGGSGKSTLCALFAQYAHLRGETVVAIDADVNIHLPRLLGCEKPDPRVHLSDPLAATKIKERLRGTNTRMKDLAAFRKSTPPGSGSHLVLIDDPTDPIMRTYAIDANGIRLMVVGTYDEEDIGASCYHSDLAILENVLSHSVDDRGVIVADMVAGTDAFASTLHAQFDMTVLVVEPTWRGIEVYRDYERLCTRAGCRHALRVIGNKIKTDEDRALLAAHIPQQDILGSIGVSPYLERQDKTWGAIQVEQLEVEHRHALEAMYAALKTASCDPNIRVQKMWELHRTYVAQPFITERFGDLTTQIDETFDIQRAADAQRLCSR